MPSASEQIEHAIEVFVRGYSSGKSATHPCEGVRVGNLWVMRDVPRRNPRDYRKEEWVAHGVPPREVDSTARQHTRGRFFVCSVRAIHEDEEPTKSDYKSLGYRLLATEPLFVHDLKRIPRAESPAQVVQVTSNEMAERFGKASRSRPIQPEYLQDDAPFRQYVAVHDDHIVGWVRSVYASDSTWCSNMYVRESHRRRGIGKAMLASMLRDDRSHGVKFSVLLSSHTGALLYPNVGYRQIGVLSIFAPKKR